MQGAHPLRSAVKLNRQVEPSRTAAVGPKLSSFTCCLAPVQEVSLAGMLSLLTAVLLQTAPAATPGEASFTALPSNFAAVALGVLRCALHSQPMVALKNEPDHANGLPWLG